MENLTDAISLIKGTPLEQSLNGHENHERLISIDRFFIQRIKFVREPTTDQYLYPGMMFAVPESVTHQDLPILEAETLRACRENPETPEAVELNLPEELSEKLSERNMESATMNAYESVKGSIYLTSSDVFWMPNHLEEYVEDHDDWDSIRNGNVVSYKDASCSLACLFYLYALYQGTSIGDHEKLILNAFNTISKEYGVNSSKFGTNEYVPSVEVGTSMDNNITVNLSGVRVSDLDDPRRNMMTAMCLYSYMGTDIDVSKYMRWA